MWSQIFVRFALSLTVYEISTKNVLWQTVIGYLAFGQTIGHQMVGFGPIKNEIHRWCRSYPILNSYQISEDFDKKLSLQGA